METADTVRRMWVAAEHVHLVTYFAPEAGTAYEAAGVTGFWRGYFGGRAAPMGAVGAGPVVATFFGFHPDFVARAVPDVWDRAAPPALVDARSAGAVGALQAVVEALPSISTDDIASAASALDASLRACSPAGRPLFAANLDLPLPDEPIAALWQACTLWREHRGDGHVAALVAAGIDGCESHVLRLAVAGGDRALMQAARGWSDGDWDDAVARLAARGLLVDPDTPTAAGSALVAEVEATTDRLAAGPVDALGAAGVDDDVLRVLDPIARAVRAAISVPDPNPIGVPPP